MEDILERIKYIIENEGISPSALADEIGISRPLMSHVMSGRNKPSLQLLLKILERYPLYSADWLLLGKRKDKAETTESSIEVPETSTSAIEPNKTAPEAVDNVVESHTNSTVVHSETEQVIVFYADKTYAVYKPR